MKLACIVICEHLGGIKVQVRSSTVADWIWKSGWERLNMCSSVFRSSFSLAMQAIVRRRAGLDRDNLTLSQCPVTSPTTQTQRQPRCGLVNGCSGVHYKRTSSIHVVVQRSTYNKKVIGLTAYLQSHRIIGKMKDAYIDKFSCIPILIVSKVSPSTI